MDNLQSAIELCRGDFLEGFSLPDNSPFEEWLLVKREQVKRLRLEALQRLSDSWEARGEYAKALAAARQGLDLEPWLEEGHQQVMRLLALTGQRSAALAQYETCRSLLAKELGVEPGAETVRLYEAIRDGTLEIRQWTTQSAPISTGPAYPAWPKHNLPLQLTSFIGREQEIAEVSQLPGREHRLVTLTGSGGVGKTRLSLAGGGRRCWAIPQMGSGLWSWPPSPTRTWCPRQVAACLGAARRAEPARSSELAGHLLARPAELLLVLDNCEHLVEACARLADALLRHCPRLQDPGHQPRDAGRGRREPPSACPSLAIPDPRQTPPTGSAAANTKRCACSSSGRAWRCPASRSTAAECPGGRPDLPAAGRHPAGDRAGCRPRAPAQRCEQIAARLDDAFRLLTGGSRTALPRHQTLRATIDWSYSLLTRARAAAAAPAVGLCRRGCPGSDRGICAGEDLEGEQILDLLSGLVSKSWSSPSASRGRDALPPAGDGAPVRP